MKDPFTILVADRNPHVREFLRRELKGEGYHVRLAKNGREVLTRAFNSETLDLIIMDLNLPDTDCMDILETLQDRIPALPVIVHSHLADYENFPPVLASLLFVEKDGSSIERLKRIVSETLRKTHPGSPQPELSPLKPVEGPV